MKVVLLMMLMMIKPILAQDQYSFTPSLETEQQCSEYGLEGDFDLVKDDNSQGFFLAFADAQVNTYVTVAGPNVYRTFFSIVYGGYGSKEVVLNLNEMTFSYRDSITYSDSAYTPIKCTGTVQKKTTDSSEL